MKIYFAASVRGGRQNASIYHQIISLLQKKGLVLTEHLGEAELGYLGENSLSDNKIFNRDIKWLTSSDCIIAEVSSPSLGVGYEIGIAEKINKPILCLYEYDRTKKISAMIRGNNYIVCKAYKNIKEVKKYINEFFSSF
tara:strand:+ start:5151 stop:5567 length:417 start_codon:yes stop_codon:yes gene_type:complete